LRKTANPAAQDPLAPEGGWADLPDDFVLPAQLIGPARDPHLEPIRRLAEAQLQDLFLIRDYAARGRGIGNLGPRATRRQAALDRRRLTDPADTRAFAFENVCHILGLAPGRVRQLYLSREKIVFPRQEHTARARQAA
jgi:hypothetical protein